MSVDKIGNYRLQLELARDSNTTLYRGTHLVLPRRANIKLVHGDKRIETLREACLLDALQHQGVTRVYESGLHEGRPWFASEVIDAPALVDFLSPGAIDHQDAIALLRDIAGVLEHAAARGVTHCGLRPERILLTGTSRGYPICIVDWSDARAHDSRPQQVVPSREAWHYTSPELVRGDPTDDRTDVFALGVIAYQMVTGKLPFDSGILAVVDDGTMLAYDRWDRPSASEVAAELAWIADHVALATTDDRPREILRIRRPRWTPAMQFKHERARTDVDIVPLDSHDED